MAYHILFVAIRLLASIPFRFLYAISDAMFYITYYVVRYRRALVRKNLSSSFPGKSKSEIKDYIENTFGYNLSRSCAEVSFDYKFNETCQKTVPESIIAFLESSDFEDAIRISVSLGGDADTMGAITGAIAEAYYNVIPEHIKNEVLKKLPEEFINVLGEFYNRFVSKENE